MTTETIPVTELKCEKAFNLLTTKEKYYAYYLWKASWEGAKICLFQCSNESPYLFMVFQRLFSKIDSNQIANLNNKFLEYASQFYANMGNYNSFGDDKFCPELSESEFQNIIKTYLDNNDSDSYDKILLQNLDKMMPKIYSNPKSKLGFPPNEVSTYYSQNITEGEIKLVQEFMEKEKWGSYNTRIFKKNDRLILKVASTHIKGSQIKHSVLKGAENTNEIKSGLYEYKGNIISVEYGDYSSIMNNISHNLTLAQEFCANKNQYDMLGNYIESFDSGSLPKHIHGSYIWTQDKNPNVESYIGFIESYRDPQGVRGEFEGFVAVVNKETSRKFSDLVKNAPKFLKLLPWDKKYEKDEFLLPDFTSLEVIGFASSGVPSGINIPNYDSVRQYYGFKNVALSNAISARDSKSKVQYILDSEQELYQSLVTPSFELQVGLHELLGHGSGKLFPENYNDGKTYDSVFTDLASSIEECRAECVGMFLCYNDEILEIFGHTTKDVSYINWLSELRAGLMGLKYYHPDTDKWGQAHMQARYVILQVCLEAGNGLVEITQDLNREDKVCIKVNRSKIESVGIPALGKFLRQIQIYKSTANATEGREFYKKYSKVEGDMIKIRELVIQTTKKRPMMVQPNLFLNHNNSVELKSYENSYTGIIKSFQERFSNLDNDMLTMWLDEKEYH
jgi:dipeptidyl-peptidase-3